MPGPSFASRGAYIPFPPNASRTRFTPTRQVQIEGRQSKSRWPYGEATSFYMTTRQSPRGSAHTFPPPHDLPVGSKSAAGPVRATWSDPPKRNGETSRDIRRTAKIYEENSEGGQSLETRPAREPERRPKPPVTEPARVRQD